MFNGDPLKFDKFLRQIETRVFDYCDSDYEKLTFLEQYTEGEPNEIVTRFGNLKENGFQLQCKSLKIVTESICSGRALQGEAFSFP